MTKYPFEVAGDQSCLKHSGQKIPVFIFVLSSLKDIWEVEDHQGLSYDGYSTLNCLQHSLNNEKKVEIDWRFVAKLQKTMKKVIILPGSAAEEHSYSNINSYVEILWSNCLPKEPIGQSNLVPQLCLKGGKVADEAEQNM